MKIEDWDIAIKALHRVTSLDSEVCIFYVIFQEWRGVEQFGISIYKAKEEKGSMARS